MKKNFLKLGLGIFRLTYYQMYFLVVVYGVICAIDATLNKHTILLLVADRILLLVIVINKVISSEDERKRPSVLGMIVVFIYVLFSMLCLIKIYYIHS